MIEQALRKYLIAAPAVAGLIGERVHPLVIPQGGKTPCITYQRSGSNRHKTTCGTNRLVGARVKLDCYSKTYIQAQALAAEVWQRLRDFSGDMQGVEVSDLSLELDLDLSDMEPGLYRQSQTYLIWYYES